MIVDNTGYIKLDKVKEMLNKGESFSIYKTHKGTDVLVRNIINRDELHLYYPLKNKLPWKTVEGKKIAMCVKLFDSNINSVNDLDISNWNNKEQIMTYEPYY